MKRYVVWFTDGETADVLADLEPPSEPTGWWKATFDGVVVIINLNNVEMIESK
jgi:hypothetical protein